MNYEYKCKCGMKICTGEGFTGICPSCGAGDDDVKLVAYYGFNGHWENSTATGGAWKKMGAEVSEYRRFPAPEERGAPVKPVKPVKSVKPVKPAKNKSELGGFVDPMEKLRMEVNKLSRLGVS